jgi:ABC-2 type transport system permease protein
MNNILLLMRRQLLAYFRAPLGYTVIVVFLAVAGLSFCRLLTQSVTEQIQVGDILFGSAYFWLTLLLTIALISMPLFAEERHSGTIETLLTAPVTDAQVVLAKFAAAYTFIIIMLAPTLFYSVVVFLLDAGGGSFSLKPVVAGYGIVLLIGAFYTAFGLLMSSLTRSMVVSAVLCCVGMSATFLAENLQYAVRNPGLERVLGQISSVQHVLDFSRGIIDSQPVIFYLSGMVLFLYLAVKSIESRLWK